MTPDFVSGVLDKLIDAAPAIAVLLILLGMVIVLKPVLSQAIEQWGKNSERNAVIVERSNQAYERAAALMREALDTERRFYGLQVEQVRKERQDVEKHLREDIKKLADENLALKGQLASLRKDIEDKSLRIYELERQLTETKHEAEERGRQRDELKRDVEQLTSELSEMRTRFEKSLRADGSKPKRARKEKSNAVKTT